MKRKKPGKALEKIAREICNSDEFVDHVASIAALYRRERDLGAAPRRKALRQSLRTFERHATALTTWLKQAQIAGGARPEHDALKGIGAQLHSSPSLALTESKPILDWLARASTAAASAATAMKAAKTETTGNAPRVAAEALRATFEHHKLKWQSGPVTVLLCAVARNAGDSALTAADARKAMSPARRAGE